VTTLSAKADSFYVHARTSVPRSGRKAQSEPQNITGGIDITVECQPALRTKVNTVSESFRHFGQCPTSGAYLRRAVGVNLNKQAPGFFRLVSELGKETTPGCIVDRPSEKSTRETFNVQVFDGDKAILINEGTAEFVLEVRPLVPDMHMSLLEKANCLSSTDTALLSPGNLSLAAPELCQSEFEVTGIINQFAIRKGGKGSQPHIDPDSALRRYCSRHINDDRKASVPLSGLSLEGERLDFTCDRPVRLEFDDTNTLDSQSTNFGQVTTIAPSGEGVAIEAITAFESGETGLLSSLNPAKESGEGLVDSSENILTGGEVGKPKVARIPNLFKLVSLVIVVKRYALHPVSIPTLLKGGIIKRTSFGKLMLQARNLCPRGIQTILEGLTHLLALLSLNVLSDSRLTHITNRTDIVATRPQTRELGSQDSELRAQNTRRSPFKLIYDMLNRLGRLSGHKNVNVVGHDFYRLKVNSKLFGFHAEHFFETAGNFTCEYLFAILRTPYQVILDVVDTALVSLISITHKHEYIIDSYISQVLVLKKDSAHSSVT